MGDKKSGRLGGLRLAEGGVGLGEQRHRPQVGLPAGPAAGARRPGRASEGRPRGREGCTMAVARQPHQEPQEQGGGRTAQPNADCTGVREERKMG